MVRYAYLSLRSNCRCWAEKYHDPVCVMAMILFVLWSWIVEALAHRARHGRWAPVAEHVPSMYGKCKRVALRTTCYMWLCYSPTNIYVLHVI